MCNKARKRGEPTITVQCEEFSVASAYSAVFAKQNLPVIWFITHDVYTPSCIRLHFWGAYETNPVGISDGGNVITICVAHENKFPGRGVNTRGSVSGTFITIQSNTHTFALSATVVAKQRAQLEASYWENWTQGRGWRGLMSDFKRQQKHLGCQRR